VLTAEAVTMAILNYASFHNLCHLMNGKLNLLNKHCYCSQCCLSASTQSNFATRLLSCRWYESTQTSAVSSVLSRYCCYGKHAAVYVGLCYKLLAGCCC